MRSSTQDPDKMFNNPFENSDEEDKFEANFANNDDNFGGDYENDPAFKSFDKFVKFVKVEEELFEDNDDVLTENSSDFDENLSVHSAIYNYEYGKKCKKRKAHLFGKEQYLKRKRRNRSLEDRLYVNKYGRTPKNIRKLRKQIRNTEDEVSPTRNSVVPNEVPFERKRSGFTEDLTKEETPKLKPRESIVSSGSKYEPTEDEIEELLEGMKDPFGTDWKVIEKEHKQKSIYSDFRSYRLRSIIYKSNDDLRQELLAIQLIKRIKRIFDDANLSLYLRPYEIIITSHSSGFIETIPNSSSIDSIKKSFPKDKNWNLCDFFQRRFEYTLEECQKNFVESLAGYSFVCYLFNIKDRHNGNILLNNTGHIIHIDFGFMFSNYPGGISFESAPFKLTPEYVQIMGGVNGEMFEYFKSLLNKAFYEVRKHLDDIISMIEIMYKNSQFPCFKGGESIFDEIKKRCSTRFNIGDNTLNEYQELVDRIIHQSMDNWRTRQYDVYQKWTNNIER